MKRSYLAILIALALLLCAASNGTADTPRPRTTTPESHRKGTTEQKPTATDTEQRRSDGPSAHTFAIATPSRATNQGSPYSTTHDTAEEERHDRKEEALEENLVCLTAILAGIEVVTTIIFLLTMFAAIKAANANKISADAGKEAAKTAELGFYTDYRPWVWADDFRMYGVSERHSGLVRYKLHNSGRTPALVTGMRLRAISSAIEPDQHPIDSEIREAEVDIFAATAIPIPPNGFIEREFRPELANHEWQAIRNEDKFLYFWGMVRYLGPIEKMYIYNTGFGAWHQGNFLGEKMELLTGAKINYFKP